VGGLAFGVHALVGLIAPAAAIYLLAARANRWDWLRAACGAVAGLLAAGAAYLLIDAINDPSSIIHTFRAHANAFGLERADFDLTLTRIGFIVTARQWRDRTLNSSAADMMKGVEQYVTTALDTFGPLLVGLMAMGAVYLLIRRPRREGVLLVAAWLGMCLYIANYHIGDIQVFYVPTYAVLSVYLAAGLALIENGVRVVTDRFWHEGSWAGIATQVALVMLVILAVVPQRDGVFSSLKRGRITFLKQQDAAWPYPVHDPFEVRLRARRLASMIEEPDALVLLDWDRLYPFCYVAHVEQGRDSTGCIETMPYGTNGKVTTSLRETLLEETARRPVYIGRVLPELYNQFSFRRVSGPEMLYRIENR